MRTKNPPTPLKAWMQAATPEEQQRLADAVSSGSRATLYQVSGAHRGMSPRRAAIVEHVTEQMHRETDGRLPRVYRTDLAKDCATCEYARQCLGPIALRTEFPVVDEEVSHG